MLQCTMMPRITRDIVFYVAARDCMLLAGHKSKIYLRLFSYIYASQDQIICCIKNKNHVVASIASIAIIK
jgi:hypothetical protein